MRCAQLVCDWVGSPCQDETFVCCPVPSVKTPLAGEDSTKGLVDSCLKSYICVVAPTIGTKKEDWFWLLNGDVEVLELGSFIGSC